MSYQDEKPESPVYLPSLNAQPSCVPLSGNVSATHVLRSWWPATSPPRKKGTQFHAMRQRALLPRDYSVQSIR